MKKERTAVMITFDAEKTEADPEKLNEWVNQEAVSIDTVFNEENQLVAAHQALMILENAGIEGVFVEFNSSVLSVRCADWVLWDSELYYQEILFEVGKSEDDLNPELFQYPSAKGCMMVYEAYQQITQGNLDRWNQAQNKEFDDAFARSNESVSTVSTKAEGEPVD